MTVKELIERLRDYAEDMEVNVSCIPLDYGDPPCMLIIALGAQDVAGTGPDPWEKRRRDRAGVGDVVHDLPCTWWGTSESGPHCECGPSNGRGRPMTDVRPIHLEGQPTLFLCPMCKRQVRGVIKVLDVERPRIRCLCCQTIVYLLAAEAVQPITSRKKRPARRAGIGRHPGCRNQPV